MMKSLRALRMSTILAGAALALVLSAGAGEPQPRRLRLYNLHTEERIDVVYDVGTGPVPEALRRIDHFLRDYRTGEPFRMDPNVLDLVWQLARDVGKPDGEFEIISGYRSPATNAALKEKGHAVATHSMHSEGKAIDLRMPGVDLERVGRAALALRRGGVGTYRAEGFVHVDTGRVRTW